MNILVLSQYWYPENGVPQRRWTWLSRLLGEEGHRVTVIAPPPHRQRKIDFNTWLRTRGWKAKKESTRGPSGEVIVRSGFVPAGRSLTLRALNQGLVMVAQIAVLIRHKKYLPDYHPDLIVGTVPALPTSVSAFVAARIFRVPYMIDLRDAWPDLLHETDSWNESLGKVSLRQRMLSTGPLQLVTWITKRILYRVLRDSAAVLATSSELSRDLRVRPELRTDEKKRCILTIRNVFPAETTYRKDVERRIDSNRLNILYAGTIGRAQDLRNAVDAVRMCAEEGLPVFLRFVGTGAAKDALLAQAAGLESHISFEPQSPAHALDEYYDWADTALVHLADWEPLMRTVPSKLYELIESGVHISAVANGETAALVEGLKVGHVVAPGSPELLAGLWRRLLERPDMLKIGDAGRTWVDFEREVAAPELLRQLIATAAGEVRK